MSEEAKDKSQPAPDSQKQRWVKYGANVTLTVVVVILLAAAITFLAQRYNRRIDTTAQGFHSLKPQTLSVIRDLDEPVRIVSLYQRPDQQPEGEPDYAQVVADLLNEYARKGRNITVENIDPVKDLAKKEELIQYVTQRYGGEVERYRTYVDDYQKVVQPLRDFAASELPQTRQLPFEQIAARQLRAEVEPTIKGIENLPQILDDTQQSVERLLRDKPPDYRGAVDVIESRISSLSEQFGEIVRRLENYPNQQDLPEPVRAYAAEAAPRYQQIRQSLDELAQQSDELGELKLDEVRRSLEERNPILVLGPNEMRSLPFHEVWQLDQTAREFMPDARPQRRFAGEQQVTTAIFSLTQTERRKVVFVRPGGAPLTTPGFPPFQRGGPFAQVAQRLRDYNFEVLEKDLSGMWAMQAQMQQMPAPPEPSDDEIRDAIWVVLNVPMDPRMSMGMPTTMAPRIHEHLASGGSALVLMMPQADDLAVALKEWGVEALPDAMIVHEVAEATGQRPTDVAQEAQRFPQVFVVNEFGSHAIARPLRSLDALLAGVIPIRITEAPGLSSSTLLPIPSQPPSWGERDMQSIESQELRFDPARDVAPPLYAGAAVDKEGAGRLVVLGGVSMFMNDILNIPDVEMLRQQRRLVARFPGNGDLFANSIFWLANMETMIEISPAAMEVARIAPMSPAAERAWRTVVLLVVLPLLVVAAGLGVYFARRD
jgi:hypothetical protein